MFAFVSLLCAGFTCGACPSGYSGTGIGVNGCTDVDDCANNACGAQASSCEDMGTNERKCGCKAGYSAVGTSLPGMLNTTAGNPCSYAPECPVILRLGVLKPKIRVSLVYLGGGSHG